MLGQENILDRISYHSLTINFEIMNLLRGNLESPIHLPTFLESRRKLESPEEIHKYICEIYSMCILYIQIKLELGTLEQ